MEDYFRLYGLFVIVLHLNFENDIKQHGFKQNFKIKNERNSAKYIESPQNAFGMKLTQYPEGYGECELSVKEKQLCVNKKKLSVNYLLCADLVRLALGF